MRKYRAEEKVQICEVHLSGKSSVSELCAAHGLSRGKPQYPIPANKRIQKYKARYVA